MSGELEALCRACGLCCDGTLFTRVPLTPTEVVPEATLAVRTTEQGGRYVPQRCAALEKQFDEASKTSGDGRNLPAAKKLRAEGGHLCDIGRHAAGALHLSEALAEIGLEPKEPQAP